MSVPQTPILMFLVALGLVLRPAHSDPHFVGVRCADSESYTRPSPYQANLNKLLQNLTAVATTTSTWYSSSTVRGEPDDTTTVYGSWYCRGDRRLQECRACVASATSTIVSSCPAQREAVVWYEECVLRYANRDIITSRADEAGPWAWRRSASNVSQTFNMDDNQFGQALVNALQGLVMQAAYNYTNSDIRFYGSQTTRLAPTTRGLSGLVQCSPGVGTGQECEACLRRLLGPAMTSCCGRASAWAMVFGPSCLLVYTVVTSVTPTLRQTQSSALSSDSNSGKRWVTIGTLIGAAIFAILFFLVIWWCLHRRRNNEDFSQDPMPMPMPLAPPPSPPPPPPPMPPHPFAGPGEMEGSQPSPTFYLQNVYVHNYYGPFYDK